jgi:hypothetical protein
MFWFTKDVDVSFDWINNRLTLVKWSNKNINLWIKCAINTMKVLLLLSLVLLLTNDSNWLFHTVVHRPSFCFQKSRGKFEF